MRPSVAKRMVSLIQQLSEETRHQLEMTRLHRATFNAYRYTQQASNNEELTTMQVDTADIAEHINFV
jgi:hypothetical protein